MELPQSDAALERFDRLKVREVKAKDGQTAAAFLAQFQSTAASLEPDERIKLEVNMHRSGVELMKAVLADPQASTICSLRWQHGGKEDVNLVIPLLINSCPELASLEVYFKHHFAVGFISSMLEHPSNKIKELAMPSCLEGDFARFFAALGQSQVSALTLSSDGSPEFAQDLCEYLAKDLLARLKVTMYYKQVPPEMLMPLAKCTRLAKLEMLYCTFSQSTVFVHFPKSVTKLELRFCTFAGGFDWSFLAGSNVRELDLDYVSGVDGNQFGGALAVHLGAKGLDELRFSRCGFVNATLVGGEIGRIKRLELDGHLSDASIGLIALVLQSPNSEMKELVLDYSDEMASIKYHLMPALKHPNCNLIKLSFRAFGLEGEKAAKRMEDMFYKRLALFVLLQGQQMRRLYCPLQRLPVEMLRLVGQVLL
ncbi:hypothetical protein BASA81_007591 [Batrachochytrium salamandrivorans]|nr:hypothetical protein BASA81_007591 [Batrachochytrium salamandrivorans]